MGTKLKKTNRDPLEHRILEELGDLLNLRFTSGSGNALGDGDLKPRFREIESHLDFGLECKRKTTSKSHTIPWPEFIKAKTQVERSAGRKLLFVTQNSERHIMVHLELGTFKNMLEIVQEALALTHTK